MTYFAFSCVIALSYLLFRFRKKQRGAENEFGRLSDKIVRDERNQTRAHSPDVQDLLDALPYPFFSINSEGVLNRVNSQARKIFDGRDILNRNFQHVFLDLKLRSFLSKSLSKFKAYRKILRFPPDSAFSSYGLDKDTHWIIDICPLSLQGDNREIQLTMRDITASVHSDQVRKDFVANASHELRTPLSVISGYLEHLTEEEGLNHKETAQKMLETMDRHVVRINRIVDDMLLISKLESDDSVPLNLAPFCIATCVRDVIERLELVIKRQGSTIEMKVPEIHFMGDQFYWTQILFNLVENALKQNQDIPLKIHINTEIDEDDNLKIQISDNGIGIPANDLPFIFKRFYRVEKHHSQSQIKGTGLGLSIVKRAVEAHGGTITAISTPRIETIFTIIVPQANKDIYDD